MLCIDHEDLRADMVILSKSLSGGVYPVSVVLGTEPVMSVLRPGEHGSTFGGNPLACAAVEAALDVTLEEGLAENAESMGALFRKGISALKSPLVKEVRGKGLLNAVVLDESQLAGQPAATTWDVCLRLRQRGLLAKNTKGNVLRFAPPLCISEVELRRALAIIDDVFADAVAGREDVVPYRGL
ncbi:ornithine aminotransferase, partial [Cladochytrium tenue]